MNKRLSSQGRAKWATAALALAVVHALSLLGLLYVIDNQPDFALEHAEVFVVALIYAVSGTSALLTAFWMITIVPPLFRFVQRLLSTAVEVSNVVEWSGATEELHTFSVKRA